MKNKTIATILLPAIFGCSTFIAGAQKLKGWSLAWQDEFNYKGLPDAKKWGYEKGHVRNNEQQYYTDARKENVWVENGFLTITGRKEDYANKAYKNGSAEWQQKDSLAQYTSASINTAGMAGWLYGRVEVKAKLPHGKGIWPAIWMMGIDRKKIGWPGSGEIDIMEFIGNHPTDIYGTIHYADAHQQHRSSGNKTTDSTLKNDFHVYAIEWDKDAMDLYFDNRKFHHFVIDSAGTGNNNPFRKPFYLLLNLAMGADWPGPIDDAVLPQQFVIDYVRVYTKKN
jgi:beta-glucanase (GH16 family)